MTTIKEIASMAGVSQSTVSRMMNQSGYVSEEARKRILHVIKETEYIPSTQAKAMRTKKSNVIGVILPRISTQTPSQYVSGIDRVLSKRGFQILLVNTNLQREKEIEYLKLMKSRQVDGIILIATNDSDELIKEIRNVKLPFVAVGQSLDGFSCVVQDDFRAAEELMTYLINKGHVKIGYIGVDERDRSVGYLRKAAYRHVAEKHKLELERSWMQIGDFSTMSGYKAMGKMLTQSIEAPTAVFVATEHMAIGAMKYLKEHNYRIPEDIAIVGVGHSELGEYVEPSLTTISYPNEDAGVQAGKLLLNQIKNINTVPEKIVMNYTLLERDSV
ncbi:LacI family DNA-binding transcriptional regulator [Sporolactobacillus kofuensis]|uniref:LacI family DNA-binding transcriptional regulator n=1 Tax=Sporolactobacillus kofuensis TaxID=269672 RepID=A0ABW1WHS9_9BACL|nr:LacI family transcriptional regulator [Sporolactobacillus kofuensis]